jgi:NitT/TauT family transport system substrate-binding protein
MALVTARLAKDPVDVVAVGTLFQQAPTAYLTLTAPGAPKPQPKDMEGKTLGTQAGTEFMFKAFAKVNGIDESKVKVVTAQATVEPLMVGKMDYFLGWIVNQTYQIEQEAAKPDAPATVKGKTWQALRLADLGIRTYTDVIFASGDTLKKNPELVKRYLRAVQKGMQFVIDHPDESVEILAKFPARSRTPRSSPGASRSRTAVPERLQQAERPAHHGSRGVDGDDRLPQGRRADPQDDPGVRGDDERVFYEEVDADRS